MCTVSYLIEGFGALLRDTATGHGCVASSVFIVSTVALVSTFSAVAISQQELLLKSELLLRNVASDWSADSTKQEDRVSRHTHRPFQYGGVCGRLQKVDQYPANTSFTLMLICDHTNSLYVYTCEDLL